MSGDKSNVEIILDHLIEQQNKNIEQQDKNYNNLSSRIDQMMEMIFKLQSHHIIVPQHAEDIILLKKSHSDLKETVQKLVYDSEKRDEIKKTITNPLIMRSLWAVAGVVSCVIFMGLGFQYKSIDIKSNVERQKLMGH